MAARHEVVVIGGGNAGVSLAARLERYGVKDVALIEPRDHHLYQPLFSHIAGGRAQATEAIRPQESVVPQGVTWIRDAAVGVDANANISNSAVKIMRTCFMRFAQLPFDVASTR